MTEQATPERVTMRPPDPDGLSQALTSRTPLVLDGPMGTELMRRGYETTLPLWSAGANLDALDLVEAIHADYARAGARLHTTNTFRTNPSTLRKVGREHQAEELVRRAVMATRRVVTACEADTGVRGWVLGSMAPIEDCYAPNKVPPRDVAREEHAVHARMIADEGADGLLVETMNTCHEAEAASAAASSTGLPFFVSFVCYDDGRLLSGEPLAEAIRAVHRYDPAAVLVNCASLAVVDRALPGLAASGRPFGAYANIGTADPVIGWSMGHDEGVGAFVDATARWLQRGATIIGSCCGTTPAYTAAIADAIRPATASV